MTAIAATTARTPIAIQAFRLTVIGFLLSSEGSFISTTTVVPSEIGRVWRALWMESGCLGLLRRKEAPGVRVGGFLAFMPTPSVASTARRQASVEHPARARNGNQLPDRVVLRGQEPDPVSVLSAPGVGFQQHVQSPGVHESKVG
jgi:hypothetical protein